MTAPSERAAHAHGQLGEVREAGRRGVDPLVDSRRINLARTTSSAGALTLLGAGHALEQAGEAPYDLGCGAPLQ